MESVAYHEAGHAVMAVILGGQVKSVSVGGDFADSESEGSVAVLWDPKTSDLSRSSINQIKVALAGPIAEMVYDGDYDYLRIRSEHESDWGIALSHLKKLNLSVASESQLLKNTIVDLYETVRNDNVWSAIGDVADRLAIDEEIEGDVITDAVRFWMNR